MTVSPASARIMIDGAVVPDNPFRGQFPSGGRHQIQAFAAGYNPKIEQASLDADLVVDLSLDRRPPPSMAPPASGGQRRARPVGPSDRTFEGQVMPARPSQPGALRPAPKLYGAVDPQGGQARLHAIETRSPYRNP